MAEKVLTAALKQGAPRRALTLVLLLRSSSRLAASLYVQLQDALVRKISQLAELNAAERDLLTPDHPASRPSEQQAPVAAGSAPVGVGWFDQVRASFAWIGDVEAWRQTGRTLVERAADKPVLTALVLLVLGRAHDLLAPSPDPAGDHFDCGRPVFDRQLSAHARGAAHLGVAGSQDAAPVRLRGLASSTELPQHSDFAAGVGAGLLKTASLLAFLRFVQFVCIENGLFSVHFGWPERARAVLWQNVNWLKYALVPPTFLLAMIDMSNSQSLRDGLGRFAFLAGGLAAALFLARVADPQRGIFAERLVPGNAIWATRMPWHTLISLAPLAIAGLALWGYYDGAAHIQNGLILSIAISCGAFLAYSVAMREVLVARRRLEMRRALERREKARAQRAALQASEASGEGLLMQIEEPEVDIASISDQTRQLVRLGAFLLLSTCLYFFWREALPSLALLDVPLWQQAVVVDGATRSIPITVSNVLVALAIGVITLIASRNLPGPARDNGSPSPQGGGRNTLRRQRREPLRDRDRRFDLRLPQHRFRLEPGAVDRRCSRRRCRLRSAGDRRQLHLRPHHPVRAAGARGRYGDHRQSHRHGFTDSHPRNQHDGWREPRNHHPEQVADHRQGHQLDLDRQHHARDAEGGRALRHRIRSGRRC